MTDLHGRLEEWVVGGADGDPPRDVALHASTCDECLRLIAAYESLVAIDVGAAPAAPIGARAVYQGRLSGTARLVVGGAAGVLLLLSALVGGSGLFEPAPPQAAVDASSRPVAGDVLAGGPTPDAATATAEPSPSPRETEGPSPTDEPSEDGTLDPTFAPAIAPPLPAATFTPIVTAAPTVAPTLIPPPPASSQPPPTPPPATPTPPPTVAPTPTPDDCADGVDNDNDTFVDGLDLGCTLTGNEDGDAPPLP